MGALSKVPKDLSAQLQRVNAPAPWTQPDPNPQLSSRRPSAPLWPGDRSAVFDFCWEDGFVCTIVLGGEEGHGRG